MKIETFKLADLHESDQNERRNDQTAEALTEVISRYGYLVPMVVTADGEIVAGHARFKALQALQAEEARCVVIDADTDMLREFRLFDNLIHDLSQWDVSMLGTELRDLDAIRDMFPDIQVEAMNPDLSIGGTVTEADVVAADVKLTGKFTEKSVESAARLVKVCCSGCGEKFKVLRKDLV